MLISSLPLLLLLGASMLDANADEKVVLDYCDELSEHKSTILDGSTEAFAEAVFKKLQPLCTKYHGISKDDYKYYVHTLGELFKTQARAVNPMCRSVLSADAFKFICQQISVDTKIREISVNNTCYYLDRAVTLVSKGDFNQRIVGDKIVFSDVESLEIGTYYAFAITCHMGSSPVTFDQYYGFVKATYPDPFRRSHKECTRTLYSDEDKYKATVCTEVAEFREKSKLRMNAMDVPFTRPNKE